MFYAIRAGFWLSIAACAAFSPLARVASNSSSMVSRSRSSSSIERLPDSFKTPSRSVCLTSALNSVIFPRSFHHAANGPVNCAKKCCIPP